MVLGGGKCVAQEVPHPPESAMTQRIDLHLHSDASDGAVSVEVLIARAALSGLTTVAITEHDNLDSWDRARAAAKQNGVHIIPGIEISTSVGDQDIHMLGYEFSPTNKGLRGLIDHQRVLREERFRRILKKLREIGIHISPKMINTQKTSAPGRVHIAQAMVAIGAAPNIEMAFQTYLRPGKPAYVPHESVSPEEAIRIVHAAGGIVSMAHPIFSGGGQVLRDRLADAGLDAVEVLHPGHTLSMQEKLIRFCRERKLDMTGGSDWHGTLDETYDLGQWFMESNGVSPTADLSKILDGALPVRPPKRRGGAKRKKKH